MNFNRYYIWTDVSTRHINNIQNELPAKALILAPEEYELIQDLRHIKALDSVDLTVITGSANSDYIADNNSFPLHAKVHHWSTYWISATYDAFKNNSLKVEDANIERLYISLNNKAHNHRCLMIDELYHHDLFAHGNLSWHEPDTNKAYIWKHWKPEILLLDPLYHESLNSFNELPVEYGTTLVNLISESTINAPFITEKTCTAIMFNKPFIVFGGKDFHKELVNLGFELYDEIFDYSFDRESNTNIRLQGIIDNLNRLKNQDYNKLRNLIRDKAERNRKHMIDIATSRRHVPPAMLEYIQLLKQSNELLSGRDIYYLQLESLLKD